MHVEVAKGIRLMISESVRFFSNADMYQLEIIGPFKLKIHACSMQIHRQVKVQVRHNYLHTIIRLSDMC